MYIHNENTIKAPEQIPQHFITRHGWRIQGDILKKTETRQGNQHYTNSMVTPR